MGPLHTLSAPPPSVSVTGDLTPAANAYFALGIDAAASLAEAPGYRNLPRSEQVARARAEQLRFLTAFLDPGLRAALDLRIAADPAAATPLSAALVGRVWDSRADAAAERALQLRDQVRAAVPRYVAATPVEDADAVARLLSPLQGTPVDSAVITRRELIAHPSRPDAGVSYYYSAVPFSQADSDWSAVYTALAASPVPAVLSVAVLPVPVPAQFTRTLQTLAGFYGRLAREGDVLSGPFRGGQRRLSSRRPARRRSPRLTAAGARSLRRGGGKGLPRLRQPARRPGLRAAHPGVRRPPAAARPGRGHRRRRVTRRGLRGAAAGQRGRTAAGRVQPERGQRRDAGRAAGHLGPPGPARRTAGAADRAG